MTSRIICIATGLFVASAFANYGVTNATKRVLTEEQRAERRAMMAAKRKAKIEAAGGLVRKPPQGNYARIVSAQEKVSLEFIDGIARQFNTGLFMQIQVSSIPASKDIWEMLKRAQELPDTGLVTLVVDDDKLPRILSAMEDGWAILNVRGLDDDLPPKDVYENRLRKEINRAFAQSAGAGLSLNKPCVMEPAFTLQELDAIKFPVISPEAMSKIQDVGTRKNIGRIIIKTYKTACQEGWAPPPTNDVQKAIWDQVHQMPTKPIKIEFDSNKGK